MKELNMPAKRDFGWELKPVESTIFWYPSEGQRTVLRRLEPLATAGGYL